ncbi:MAG: dicarboxylate/amino acid:cation symporter [Bacteroidales bacterium]|nr:dicarboxylate/amino acid:cation symporter [Bacteroidales bacterium]
MNSIHHPSILQRVKKIGLLPKIIIAIAAGIGAGYICPIWLARIFVTFDAIFSQFLGFCIPLIIIGFVAPSIADLGNKAGKMLLATALLAYLFTLGAGFLSYFTGEIFFPRLISPMEYVADDSSSATITPYFSIEMPPLMPVMSALLISFILGLGCAFLTSGTIKSCLDELRDIIMKVIGKVIIPLLPLYIFGIFLDMTLTGEVAEVMNTFIKIIAVIFGLHIFVLVLQYTIAAPFSQGSKNPLRLLWTMMPAYFTALGTQSSAATIPVTLKQTVNMGVDKDIAGFTVPLCATIHMSGSTLKLVACGLALMMTRSMPYDTSMFAGFISMLGVTIIAAPGIPGGAVMASLGLFTSMLGFSESDCALMIALYIAMDSFGTACNVTGDGAISIIIGKIFGKKR